MKLSNDTLSILKNFASINQGIYFKKGKTIRTVSTGKNIMAEAIVSEEIPTEFGVYDLNNLLSVISLHKEEPTFDFEDNNILISGLKGRSKIRYRFCAASMIVTPPDKTIEMPNPEITLKLSGEDLDWVLRAANVLSSPFIAVESNGSKVFVKTFDSTNDAAHTDSIEIAEGNGDIYCMIFKTENLKVISGGYSVKISSKGIANFKHETANIQYWIATENGSKFDKAKK